MDFDLTQVIQCEDENDEEIIESEKPVAFLKITSQQGILEKAYPIYEGENVLGRHDSCKIHIPAKALSKQHACVEVKNGCHLIYDKNSRNKTRRGKMIMMPEVRYELKHGDELVFGDLKCTYLIGSQQEAAAEDANDSGSETGSESMFTVKALDINSNPDGAKPLADNSIEDVEEEEEEPSENSDDLLMPTQPYVRPLSKKSQKTQEGKTLLVEDSDSESQNTKTRGAAKEHVTIAESPSLSQRAKVKSGWDSVVLPDSGSETDDEEGSTEGHMNVTLEEEETDEPVSDKGIFYLPTQPYVMESDDEGEETGDKLPQVSPAKTPIKTDKRDAGTAADAGGVEATQAYTLTPEPSPSRTRGAAPSPLSPTPSCSKPDPKTHPVHDSGADAAPPGTGLEGKPAEEETAEAGETEVVEEEEEEADDRDMSHLFAMSTLAYSEEEEGDATQVFGEGNAGAKVMETDSTLPVACEEGEPHQRKDARRPSPDGEDEPTQVLDQTHWVDEAAISDDEGRNRERARRTGTVKKSSPACSTAPTQAPPKEEDATQVFDQTVAVDEIAGNAAQVTQSPARRGGQGRVGGETLATLDATVPMVEQQSPTPPHRTGRGGRRLAQLRTTQEAEQATLPVSGAGGEDPTQNVASVFHGDSEAATQVFDDATVPVEEPVAKGRQKGEAVAAAKASTPVSDETVLEEDNDQATLVMGAGEDRGEDSEMATQVFDNPTDAASTVPVGEEHPISDSSVDPTIPVDQVEMADVPSNPVRKRGLFKNSSPVEDKPLPRRGRRGRKPMVAEDEESAAGAEAGRSDLRGDQQSVGGSETASADGLSTRQGRKKMAASLALSVEAVASQGEESTRPAESGSTTKSSQPCGDLDSHAESGDITPPIEEVLQRSAEASLSSNDVSVDDLPVPAFLKKSDECPSPPSSSAHSLAVPLPHSPAGEEGTLPYTMEESFVADSEDSDAELRQPIIPLPERSPLKSVLASPKRSPSPVSKHVAFSSDTKDTKEPEAVGRLSRRSLQMALAAYTEAGGRERRGKRSLPPAASKTSSAADAEESAPSQRKKGQAEPGADRPKEAERTVPRRRGRPARSQQSLNKGAGSGNSGTEGQAEAGFASALSSIGDEHSTKETEEPEEPALDGNVPDSDAKPDDGSLPVMQMRGHGKGRDTRKRTAAEVEEVGEGGSDKGKMVTEGEKSTEATEGEAQQEVTPPRAKRGRKRGKPSAAGTARQTQQTSAVAPMAEGRAASSDSEAGNAPSGEKEFVAASSPLAFETDEEEVALELEEKKLDAESSGRSGRRVAKKGGRGRSKPSDAERKTGETASIETKNEAVGDDEAVTARAASPRGRRGRSKLPEVSSDACDEKSMTSPSRRGRQNKTQPIDASPEVEKEASVTATVSSETEGKDTACHRTEDSSPAPVGGQRKRGRIARKAEPTKSEIADEPSSKRGQVSAAALEEEAEKVEEEDSSRKISGRHRRTAVTASQKDTEKEGATTAGTSGRGRRAARTAAEKDVKRDEDTPMTKASGRGRRGQAASLESEPQEEETAPTKTPARGRKSTVAAIEKEEEEETASTKPSVRGRKSTVAAMEKEEEEETASTKTSARGRKSTMAAIEKEEEEETASTKPSARGRKSTVAAIEKEEEEETASTKPSARGRKSTVAAIEKEEEEETASTKPSARGRKSTVAAVEKEEEEETASTKPSVRGRKSTVAATEKGDEEKTASTKPSVRGRKSTVTATEKEEEEETASTKPSARGRKSTVAAIEKEEEEETASTKPSVRGKKSTMAVIEKADEVLTASTKTSTRGRKSTVAVVEEEMEEEVTGTKTSARGRKSAMAAIEKEADKETASTKTSTKTSARGRKPAVTAIEEKVKEEEEEEEFKSSTRGRRAAKATAEKEEETTKGRTSGKGGKVTAGTAKKVEEAAVSTRVSGRGKRAATKDVTIMESERKKMAMADREKENGAKTSRTRAAFSPADVGSDKTGETPQPAASLPATPEVQSPSRPSEGDADMAPSGGRGRKRGRKTREESESMPAPTTPHSQPGPRTASRDSSKSDLEVTPAKKGRKISNVESPSLRKTSLDLKPKVLFTGVCDEHAEKILKDLGGEVASSVFECTHLVTDKMRRTVKFLCGMARGLPIVTPQWLNSCKQAGTFLDGSKFLVADFQGEKQHRFSLQRSLEKASEAPMLAGYRVHVTKSVKPAPQQMKDILLCAGAKYLATLPKKLDDDVIVISCEEDKDDCQSAVQAGIPVVGSEFILTGVLRQEVDFDSYRLLAPGKKGSGSGQGRRK